jgi:hypothetical protein
VSHTSNCDQKKDVAILEEAGSGLEETAVRSSTIAKERRQLVGIHSR